MILETITAYATSQIAAYVGGSIAVFVLGWILKKIPTHKWAETFRKIGVKQGTAVTTFFNAKLPKLYNGVIEPVFIDTVHALLFSWWGGFIAGLKSDNPE